MSEQHLLALPQGFQLNQYTIDSVLGQGGFGIVYKAHHQHLGEVVIKEFLPADMAGRDGDTVTPHSSQSKAMFDDSMQRFLNEGRVLVKLKHPNIVRCRDLFEANGTAYLVMDYEDGLPFSDLLKSIESSGGSYSEAQLLQVFIALAKGLDYIHQQNVLHRDIKPGNLFIRREDNSPVLLDFGAAKQEYAEVSQSRAPYTEFYAPIEQSDPSVPATDKIDIHAFGGLMYRAVTGQIGPKAESRALNIATGQGDPLTPAVNHAQGKYSEELLNLIDQCLAFSTGERPNSMAEVVSRLTAIANQAASPAKKKESVSTSKSQSLDSSNHSNTQKEIIRERPTPAPQKPWALIFGSLTTLALLIIAWQTGWFNQLLGTSEKVPNAFLVVSEGTNYLDLDKSGAEFAIIDMEKSLLINNQGQTSFLEIIRPADKKTPIKIYDIDNKKEGDYVEIFKQQSGYLGYASESKLKLNIYPLEIAGKGWITNNLERYFTAPEMVSKKGKLCEDQRFAWISTTESNFLAEGEWVVDKFKFAQGFHYLTQENDETFVIREYFDRQTQRLITASRFLKKGKAINDKTFYEDTNPDIYLSYGCEKIGGQFVPVSGVIIPETRMEDETKK